MPEPPSGRGGERSESWAETNRARLAWSRTWAHGSQLRTARPRHFLSVVRCPPRQARSPLRLRDAVIRGWQAASLWLSHRHLPAAGGRSVDALTAGPGASSFSGSESFPLCYTAGRHEGARREAKLELMNEPADRAVLLLQRVSELLFESRAIAQQLEVVQDGEPSADAADRIAYGILAAALEEGLVTTIRHVQTVQCAGRSYWEAMGEVLGLLEIEAGMHSCLEPKPSVAGERRRQEEASPWGRGYRHRSAQASSLTSCSPRV